MSRDDLENLLRNHLSNELDSQRGRAAKAFESQVIKPMQVGLEKRSRQWYTLRSWSLVGAAMAACIAIGYGVPRYFTNNTPIETIVQADETSSNPINTETVNYQPGNSFQQTSFQNSIDAGAVMLKNNLPGRKIIMQEVNHYSWTEPTTGGKMEVIVPAEKDLYLQVHQQ